MPCHFVLRETAPALDQIAPLWRPKHASNVASSWSSSGAAGAAAETDPLPCVHRATGSWVGLAVMARGLMPLCVPLTRLCYSYSLGDGSRDRDRDQWERVMSSGPLSDTFPGNLAGAAALWRPRQRGEQVVTGWVGAGLSSGAASPTERTWPF